MLQRVLMLTVPLFAAALLLGCQSEDDSRTPKSFDFDFSKSAIGWSGGRSDFSTQTAPENVTIDVANAPSPFTGTTYLMTGINRSDDLFLFAKKQIGGLRANQRYQAQFTVQFLSNAPSGCFGVGGAPGEAVTLKAGMSAIEPLAIIDANGDYTMNIDKGDQTQGGTQAQALGNIANGRECDGTSVYVSKTLRSTTPLTVTTDANGSAWLLVGLDSGFEAGSTVYYQDIQLTLTPQ